MKRALVLLLLLAQPVGAKNVYLIDTGPGPDNVDIATVASVRCCSDQWLGFRLDLGKRTVVNAIDGWMVVVPDTSIPVARVSVYRDNGGPGELLYSDTFALPVTDPTGTYSNADWRGIHGIHWVLRPGSYWITFEADPTWLTGAGFLLGVLRPVPAEAIRPLGGEWQPAALGMGLRVRTYVR